MRLSASVTSPESGVWHALANVTGEAEDECWPGARVVSPLVL